MDGAPGPRLSLGPRRGDGGNRPPGSRFVEVGAAAEEVERCRDRTWTSSTRRRTRAWSCRCTPLCGDLADGRGRRAGGVRGGDPQASGSSGRSPTPRPGCAPPRPTGCAPGWRHAAVVRRYQSAGARPAGARRGRVRSTSRSWRRWPGSTPTSGWWWCCITSLTSATHQIAEELGVPEGTVKSRLSRARETAGCAARRWGRAPCTTTPRSHVMPEIDELRGLADQIRPPDLDALRATAVRRDRRARAALVAGVVAAVLVIGTTVLLAGDRDGRTLPEPVAPTPTPSRPDPEPAPADEPTDASDTSMTPREVVNAANAELLLTGVSADDPDFRLSLWKAVCRWCPEGRAAGDQAELRGARHHHGRVRHRDVPTARLRPGPALARGEPGAGRAADRGRLQRNRVAGAS